MGFSIYAKNYMLDALAGIAGFASLHTALPNDSGSNEVTGGSPAYARKAITWNAASGGALDDSNQPVFDVPATTVAYFGLWSAASAGTFYSSGPLGASTDPMPFFADDVSDIFSVDNHGFQNDDTVVLIDVGAMSVIPTGVTEGVVYFVRTATTDSFQLATTSGGGAIDLTTDGSGMVQKIKTEVFASQGTYTLTDADLALLG